MAKKQEQSEALNAAPRTLAVLKNLTAFLSYHADLIGHDQVIAAEFAFWRDAVKAEHAALLGEYDGQVQP